MPGLEDLLQSLANTDEATQSKIISDPLPINQMGPYPLARDVEFSGPSGSGELLLTLEKASVAGLVLTKIEPAGDSASVSFSFDGARLGGTYDIYGIEQPKIDLDVGGALQPLTLLGAAPDDDGEEKLLTEQQFDQLQQANDQKAELSKTAHGRTLLSSYKQFNDAYNYVFTTNTHLRTYWKKDGATTAMADHTSKALKDGSVVNPSDQTWGTSGQSYNYNAWNQKGNVYVACWGHAQSDKIPPDQKKYFYDAANEAVKFGSSVKATGNPSDSTTPMSGSEVFKAVADTPPPSELSAQDQATLSEAVQKVGTNTHDDSHIRVLAEIGLPVHDKAIQGYQAIYQEGNARSAPPERVDLWTGPFSTDLQPFEMTFLIVEEPDGHVSARLTSTTLEVTELEMDTSDWTGEAGAAAKSALSKARFLNGLVHDRITSALRDQIVPFIEDQA